MKNEHTRNWKLASAIGLVSFFQLHAETSGPNLKNALIEAVRGGDKTAVRTLLKKGADPNTQDAEGTPMVMNAVLYGDAECVRMLLDRGANPNAKNGAGATALLWAAGDPEKALLLLSRGADANVRSALGRTPLLAAAAQDGASNIVKSLLAKGADVKAKDELDGLPPVPTGGGRATPVIEAAKARDGEALRLLLAKGVDINARDGNGGTALSEATVLGNVENVRVLLAAGANVQTSVAMWKFTPLTLAAVRNDPATVRMLLDAEADVNGKDGTGSTPFMWAAYSERGNPEVLTMLHEAGADLNITNQKGETALTWAIRNGETPIVELLKKWGAQ